jgi:type I restriction enzyme M protein
VFKKCREVDDVLFIDASTCFEKGKNENRLRDEDVDRITTAYRTRSVEARFSHRAPLAEIAGNDFNLNIPRYVDTFTAEAAIDLAAVTRDLAQIEADMAGVNAEIRAFCAELGLESPV